MSIFSNLPPWAGGTSGQVGQLAPSNWGDTIKNTYPTAPATSHNDITVRQVTNGWVIYVGQGYGASQNIYVAATLDEVADIMKIVAVKKTLDKAK